MGFPVVPYKADGPEGLTPYQLEHRLWTYTYMHRGASDMYEAQKQRLKASNALRFLHTTTEGKLKILQTANCDVGKVTMLGFMVHQTANTLQKLVDNQPLL